MPSPNTSYSELITTTLQERSGKLADNVSKSSAFLDRLNRRGNIRKFFTGGRTILQELEYAENGTFRRYSGYDLLDPSPSDIMTAAEFEIKQAAVAVSMSGLEMLQNAGDAAVLDLMASRIRNAERTLVNNIANDVFSLGIADGGRQIGGLSALVSDTPTSGVVGGIDSATWTFWQNQMVDSGSTITSANVLGFLNSMAITTSRGNDAADLIVMNDGAYTAYMTALTAMQQITTQGGTVGAGFAGLKFFGPGGSVDVVLERSAGPFANTGMAAGGRIYFLNTNYLHFRPHADRNFTVDDLERVNTNQDAFVKYIFWAGNMTISNRAVQGVIKD